MMRHGRRTGRRLALLTAHPNGLPESRVGFAVGKRVGNAVIRNRTKRRIREILRRLPLRPGYDIVIVARPESGSASYQELAHDIETCADRGAMLCTR